MSERNGRKVIERIFIEGTLLLETPAHFGNGDAADVADMTLARDAVDPQPGVAHRGFHRRCAARVSPRVRGRIRRCGMKI